MLSVRATRYPFTVMVALLAPVLWIAPTAAAGHRARLLRRAGPLRVLLPERAREAVGRPRHGRPQAPAALGRPGAVPRLPRPLPPRQPGCAGAHRDAPERLRRRPRDVPHRAG